MVPIKDNIDNDRFPLVTTGLIVVNVFIYVVTASHGSLISGPDGHELIRYGATPHAIADPSGRTWVTVFSSMFVHASIVQLAVNMLFLWIFGNTVEDSMRPARFLGFYIVGGLAALAVQVAIGAGGNEATVPTVGAAGAISAVVGGYAVLYPRARVIAVSLIPLFFTVLEIPVLVMVALWFVVQVVFTAIGLTEPIGGGGGGAAAYLAHVGGFLFGLAVIRPVATRRKTTPPTMAAFR
jgi:membrane associated rhomboid family serine protease